MKHFLLFLFALLLCSSFTLAQEYTPDANTVALYHLNEVSGDTAYDASGHGNNGVASGTTIIEGRFNQARYFNGITNAIVVPDTSSLDLTDSLTLELWVKPSDFNSGLNKALIWKGDASGTLITSPYILGVKPGNTIWFLVTNSVTWNDVTSKSVLLPDVWYHIACVADGESLKLYINGILDSSVVQTIHPFNGAFAFQLGHIGNTWNNTFHGTIDEVRISNKAREPWEFHFPIVKSVTPAQNALHIPKSTSISATFNVPMNMSTVNTNNVLVYGSTSGKHAGTITTSGDTAFTINPSSDFMYGEVVNVTLTTNILSANGDSLINGYHWSFTMQNRVSPGTFASKVEYATDPGATGVFIYDVDGDGDGDLVVTNYGSGTVSLLKNNGDGTFASKVNVPGVSNPSSTIVSDVDGDGDGDLIVGNIMANNFSIFKNNGDGTFGTKADYTTGSGTRDISISDIDGDGDGDLAVTIWYDNKVSIFKNQGDGTYTPTADYGIGSNPDESFFSDLDGDGDVDLVVANMSSDNVSIFKNNGDGTFSAKVDYATSDKPTQVFNGDLDNDGDCDIAVVNNISKTVSILKNNGDGTFADRVDYATGDTPDKAFIYDLDGDGDGDIAISNNDPSTVSILKNNGDGTFSAKVDYATANRPIQIFISDVDNDGDGDIAVAHWISGDVSILKNADTELVAYYPFNGNANDESGNGHHGSANGVVQTIDRFGNPDSAYLFDGANDVIAVENGSLLNPTDEITIAAWINPNEYHGYQQAIVSKHDDYNTSSQSYYLAWSGGIQPMDIAFYISENSQHFYFRASNIVIPTSSGWHYVVGVFKKNELLDIYIDGKLANDGLFVAYDANNVQTTDHIPSQIASTVTPVRIGGWVSAHAWFDGSIDDISIYNRALSQSEIDSLYHEGGWDISSISGTKFNDLNGNGTKDPGESGLENWTMVLSGKALDTVYTNSSGYYAFTTLDTGTYVVSETMIEGWIQTSPPTGMYTVVLDSLKDTTGFDFGNIKIPQSEIVEGWNLMSVPLNVPDYRKSTLFPSASSNAFTYEGQYVIKDMMYNGVGYWLKFAAAETIAITGTMITTDTIEIRSGWNMIGSLSVPIPISSITSDPPGLQASDFFYYDGTYRKEDTVMPFKGYWLKANGQGNLILSTNQSAAAIAKNAIRIVHTSELPPPPPDGSTPMELAIPKEFGLQQAYPNPFNPTTTIRYELPTDSKVNLKVYNPLGQVVAVLVDESQTASYKSVEWNAGVVSSGIYFYKLEATSSADPSKSFVQVKKMLLIK